MTVLSSDGEWSKVSVDGKTGYMQTRWLSVSKPNGGSTAVHAVRRSGRWSTIRAIRRFSSCAGRRPQTAKLWAITVTARRSPCLPVRGDWYKVSVDGKTGYMMAKYLKVTGEAHNGSARVFNANGGSYVNFRSRASLSASVIRTVPVGTTVKVLEKTTDWTKVEVDGKTGYISTWFLKF